MIKIIQIEFHQYTTFEKAVVQYMQWAHYFAFMLLLYYYCKAITYENTRKTWNTDFIIVCQNFVGLYFKF